MSNLQLHFADHDILPRAMPPDVLMAMNPAALKANLADVPCGADIIANTGEFTKRNLCRVNHDETTEVFSVQYEVKPTRLHPGTGRNITGNRALAIGLAAASRRSGLPLMARRAERPGRRR